MTTTLSEGVKVPDVGSVNWAGDLEVNWNLLNGALANLSGNVKLDRDNTWTGEQSFTLPIVGSITGTASKTIADEDGTSIKTGYVNVAGNQTISGQKTWNANAFFNTGVYHRNNSYEIGNTPTSNVAIPIYFTDKNNIYTGYVRNVVLTTSRTQTELYARNKFTSGALSPTGTDVTSTLQVEVQSNGDKTLYFDGSIRNNVLPYTTNTYSLGSSSYQWSSVYAQTYYYNGTAWGLDKANVWSAENTYTSSVLTLKQTGLEIGVTPASNQTRRYRFTDKNNADLGWMQHRVSASGDSYLELLVDNKFSNGQLSAQGSDILNSIVLGLHSDGSRYLHVLGDVSPDLPTRVCNLGTSTNKWKTLNGVNPGALSLPDLNSDGYVNLSSNISVNTQYTYTAPSDGWLCLYVQTSGFHAENAVAIFNGAGTTDSHRWANSATSSINLFRMGVYHGAVSVPVRSGNTYFCYISVDSSTSLAQVLFYFYKATGNV